MSATAKSYIAAILLAGYGLLFYACLSGGRMHWTRLAVCLAMVVLASPLKVALPGVPGTLSINYMVSLLAMSYLSLPGALLVAAAGSLTQCVWQTKDRPKAIQILFSIAGTILSAGAGYEVFYHGSVLAVSANIALRYFAASLVYFFLNTALISLVMSLTGNRPIFRNWYENFFFTAPQYLICAVLAWAFSVVYESLGWEVAILLLPAVYLVERSYRIYLGRLGAQQEHAKRMAELHLRTIKALALAIDAKDETTHDHLRRMQVYSTEIARELGLSEELIQALNAAALLHDIGKLAIPEYIISKPGKLTAEEFEKMKVHPVVGAEILEAVEFPYPVVPIVRSHHERWDGSGYPDGLRGEAIPIGARILAVVDSLDALASDRQYRAGVPLEDAIAIIGKESGRNFDPRVVEIVTRRFAEFEKKTKATKPTVTRVRTFRGATQVETAIPDGGPNTADLAQMNFTLSIAAARQEIQTLLEVTRDIGTSLSIDDTFSLLAGRLKNIVPHDSLAIYIHDGQVLRPEYVAGTESKLFGSLEIPVGQGLSGWVFEKQQPVVNGSPSVEPGYLNDPTKFSTLRSALAVPLDGSDGAIGALALYSSQADAFTQDHLRLLMAISSKSGTAIENALRYKQAQRSAATDELTGLPNARSLFLHLDNEVKVATASDTTLTILVTDLDGFKSVNDHFGHLEGNRLLHLTAQGLRQLCRGADYVARMGGDEFVVILRGATPEAVDRRTTQMREMVEAQGLAVTGRACVSLSVGQSVFPVDAASAELLLDIADKRMFAIKQELYRSGKKKRGEMFIPAS